MKQKIFCVIALILAPFGAQAATVQLVGTDTVYEYDTVTNAGALALFGTPTIVGNTVRFIPPSFRAESTNGEGAVIASANFIFDRVYSLSGQDLNKINIIEFGDYRIDNGGSVDADLLLTVANNADAFEFASDNVAFSDSGDSSGKQTWDLNALVNPAAEFSSAADDVALTIQNTLTANTANPGEVAWIQKKLAFVATTVVPIPAAAWLFGSSLLGLVLIARRK